jgi:hypothetical protein
MKEYYFVNAYRPNGMSDFLFPEYETFEELEYGIMILNAIGYEINTISLVVEEI